MVNLVHKTIAWELRYKDGDKYTGERDWHGFVDGKLLYRVVRGGWISLDTEAGDSCRSEKDGKETCYMHLNGMLD